MACRLASNWSFPIHGGPDYLDRRAFCTFPGPEGKSSEAYPPPDQSPFFDLRYAIRSFPHRLLVISLPIDWNFRINRRKGALVKFCAVNCEQLMLKRSVPPVPAPATAYGIPTTDYLIPSQKVPEIDLLGELYRSHNRQLIDLEQPPNGWLALTRSNPNPNPNPNPKLSRPSSIVP